MMERISDIALLQTADAEQYLPMLEATTVVNQIYCARHHVSYSQFIGIKRGFHPWHACFNRILLIKEMIDSGFNGWLFYLDADAFVADLSYDVRYLISEIAKPIIMAPGGLTGEHWDVNDGVMLIDLANESARDLVLAWHRDFMAISEETLRTHARWDGSLEGDQERLHRILQEKEHFKNCIGMADRYLFNDHKGSFVRQILRSNAVTWEERLVRVRKETADILNAATAR
jgi:hypothetical protein